MNHHYQKDISGCGISGIINKKGVKVPGKEIIKSIVLQRERGNGLGSGYAGYGIYPDYKDFYAFHVMYDTKKALQETEDYLNKNLVVEKAEDIPTKRTKRIQENPLLRRYFVKPNGTGQSSKEEGSVSEDDLIVKAVMKINFDIDGAYVFSSGKNMGAFKGVGFPEDIAEFFRIDEYEAHIWTAHNRFPTNTPGWWGGAHPFTLLDWSIVHNGEISSYGINKRYLEMDGYKCTLMTDTEVVAYLLDQLVRKHGLSIKLACVALAAPFWKDIDAMPDDDEKEILESIRIIYGSALLNGPFAILFGHKRGLVGMNDRVKLRPLVAGEKGDYVYMASEESAIWEICPDPDRVWTPRAGEPVIVELDKDVGN
jgi:glutamate synthase domain-containing protein 1